jgi:mitogen-activated protein kinase-activated protein kinase 2
MNVRTPKTTNITDIYKISDTVLGLGINGKVLQCYSKATNEKFALKVSDYALNGTMEHG